MKMKIRLLVCFCAICLFNIAIYSQTEDTPNPNTPKPSIDQTRVKQLLDKAQQAILRGDDLGADKYLGQAVDIAYKAWDLGDATTSESIFRQILKLKSDYPKALFGLAELYRRINPSWAIEYYTRYLRVNPGDPAAYFGRGTCYLMRNAYSLAVQDLKYLVDRLQPNHIQGLTNLALALRGQAVEQNYDPDSFKQAVDYMRRAVESAKQQTDKPEIKELISSLLYRFGRMQFEYQQILAKANPEQANFNDAINSLEQSIAQAKKILKEKPDDAQIVNQIILSLDALTEVYNEMIRINPKDTQAYDKLVKLTVRKSYALAMQLKLTGLGYLRKGVQANDKDPELRFMLSRQYAQMGMIKDAIQQIEQAIKLAPNTEKYKQFKRMLIASTQPSTKPAKK